MVQLCYIAVLLLITIGRISAIENRFFRDNGLSNRFGSLFNPLKDASSEDIENLTLIAPVAGPTKQPTGRPTASPTRKPTSHPTVSPTSSPTRNPTPRPTSSPTSKPTESPTKSPTNKPTASPTKSPTNKPTASPTKSPTNKPTASPTISPTEAPTTSPTKSPTNEPTKSPTESPTDRPTPQPTKLHSGEPTASPTTSPTGGPTVAPTISPTKNPTENPTVSPTKAPVVEPTKTPTTSPTGEPTESPTTSPTKNPTVSPSKSPTSVPSSSPSSAPTALPSASPTEAPVPRTARHKMHWFSMTEGCEEDTPDAFVKCEDGGILTVIETENASYQKLADDRIRGSAISKGDEAIMIVKCAGYTDMHLTATLEVFNSKTSGCNRQYYERKEEDHTVATIGGSSIVFGTIGRYCRSDDGLDVLSDYACKYGYQGTNEFGANFCAQGSYCQEDLVCDNNAMETCVGTSTCDMEIEGVSVSDYDLREECWEEEPTLDLSRYHFVPSVLASLHQIELSHSGIDIGCRWHPEAITIQCQNNGLIELFEEIPGCERRADDTYVCTGNGDKEDTDLTYLSAWCYGDNAEQLEITATSYGDTVDGICIRDGMSSEGIGISRACGALEGGVEFKSSKSFCDYADQAFEIDASYNMCVADSEVCDYDYCLTVTVPEVRVTSTDINGDCIYAL